MVYILTSTGSSLNIPVEYKQNNNNNGLYTCRQFKSRSTMIYIIRFNFILSTYSKVTSC